MNNISSVSTMRGFEALTQGEEKTVERLLENVIEEKSKIKGFKKTRVEAIMGTEEEVYKDWVKLSLDVVGGDKLKSKQVVSVVKNMAELVTRDFCTKEMAITLAKGVKNRFEVLGSVDKTVESISRYLKSGVAIPNTEVCRHAEREIEEGEIIFEQSSAC